jgi:TRAP-type C4-dicarboxylate transport system permease small subunit
MKGLLGLWFLLRVALKNLSRLALLGILGLTVVDVGGRYLFNQPFEGTTTIITDLLFPAVVFLSLAYVAEIDGHVRVELIWAALRRRPKRALEIVFAVAIVVFWGVVAYLAGERAHEAYVLDQRPISSVGVPIALSYAVVCLGSVAAAIMALASLAEDRWRPARLDHDGRESPSC